MNIKFCVANVLLDSCIYFSQVSSDDGLARANWFRTMLSIPPRKQLTILQKFTAWSAFIAYLSSGVLSVVFPQIVNFALFNMKLSGRDYEYGRLVCSLLAVIGFLYIVIARSSPLVTGDGAILGTVPERLFAVPAALFWFYYQSLIPTIMLAAFVFLDPALAVATYIIWACSTPGASLKRCFEEIAGLVHPFRKPSQKWSSTMTQGIGYFQLVVSLILLAKPEFARDALGLDAFKGYSQGLIAVYFMCTAVIGWLHVLGGGDGNESLPIGAVVYRLGWTMPLVSLMYCFDCIERGFVLALVVSDLISVLIISIPLCIELCQN